MYSPPPNKKIKKKNYDDKQITRLKTFLSYYVIKINFIFITRHQIPEYIDRSVSLSYKQSSSQDNIYNYLNSSFIHRM